MAAPEQLADTLRRHCRGNLRRGESCWELRGLTPTDSEPVLGAFKGLADEIVHAIGRLGSSGPSDEAIDPGLVVELREGEASNAIDVLENLWAAIELADEEAVVTMLKSIIVAPDGGHEAIGALRVAAASTLLLDHSSGHWAAVSDLLMVDPNFGLAVARRSATNRSGSGFGRVPAATVAAIYEWLSSLYPSHQDTHRNGFVSPDQQAQDLRRSLLNELARRADAEALDAVRALCERLPDSIEVRATLVRARANSRAESWRGPSQADLHKMLESNTRRLVRNDDELFSVVVEALREIAVELETHGEFLWDRHVDLVGTTLWEPKYESSFSLYMAQQLRLRLSRTPTVVNREVVVRHTTATGAGERADILVQAPAADPGDQPASVVIEVKGQWNADLLVSLRSQLVDRYLPAANSRAGIYLVGWFPVEGWNHESWRRSSAARRKRRLVADDLEEQAKSCHGQTVKAILIDIPRPSVANDRSATDRPASG